MDSAKLHMNEHDAAKAFSRQAPVFDGMYGNNTIINYKRRRVREAALQHLYRCSKRHATAIRAENDCLP